MPWYLGRTNPKVMHREGCRHARMEYTWAGELSPEGLVRTLEQDGAQVWHRGCRVCARDLDDLIEDSKVRRLLRLDREREARESASV